EDVEASNSISFIPSFISATWKLDFVLVLFSKNKLMANLSWPISDFLPALKSIAESIKFSTSSFDYCDIESIFFIVFLQIKRDSFYPATPKKFGVQPTFQTSLDLFKSSLTIYFLVNKKLPIPQGKEVYTFSV